jgi:hypothetical protein
MRQVQAGSIQLKLGAVKSAQGMLTFAFTVRDDGDAHLQIYACDPKDLRKSGVILFLNQQGYDELKQMILKTDEAIEKLRGTGHMKSMLARL